MVCMELRAGAVVGERYVLAAALSGEVWRATDQRTGQAVAVRFVTPPDDARLALGFAARLHPNARMLSRLRDPRVVGVIESGEDPAAGLFLVTQLAGGRPLSEILERERRLTPERSMAIVAGAAEALAAVHDFGVWHCDLHPGCLFVDAKDRVELGLSRYYLTRRVSPDFGPHAPYLAPEVAMGESPCPESDIYGLGIIAYECLTGSPPFASDNPIEVAYLHVRGVPAPLPAELPRCVAAIVDRAMSKRAEDRWRRATDLAVAARTCAAGHDTGRVGAG